MSAAVPPDPPAHFADPRVSADFLPEHWPLANGAELPSWDEAGRHERRCIEFLASYYRLNRLNHAVLSLPAAGDPDDAAGAAARMAAEAAMSSHEALEDRYAPAGFYGDPEMSGVFYRNILFLRPSAPRMPGDPDSHGILSSFLAVPGLEEIPAEELRGDPVFTRWDDGKVDL